MADLDLRFGSRRAEGSTSTRDWCGGGTPVEPGRVLVMANAGARGPGYVAICPDGRRIPGIGHGPRAAPAVDAFNLPTRVEVVVYPARAPAQRSVPRRGMGLRAVAATVAGLPVLLLPGPVWAAPTPAPAPTPEPAPTEAARPPALPDDATPETTRAPEPAPAPQAAPVPEPAPPAPVPDTSTIDAAWEGVVGYDVVLEFKDGSSLEVRVTAVQQKSFTAIDFAAGGKVWVFQKDEVQGLYVKVPPALPTNTGTGMLAGGAVLTALGAPVLLTGIVFLGIYPSGFVYISLPTLLTGGPAVGAGIALLVAGSKRRRAYNAAMSKRRISLVPSGGRTRLGTWTGGLTLRF